MFLVSGGRRASSTVETFLTDSPPSSPTAPAHSRRCIIIITGKCTTTTTTFDVEAVFACNPLPNPIPFWKRHLLLLLFMCTRNVYVECDKPKILARVHIHTNASGNVHDELCSLRCRLRSFVCNQLSFRVEQ